MSIYRTDPEKRRMYRAHCNNGGTLSSEQSLDILDDTDTLLRERLEMMAQVSRLEEQVKELQAREGKPC